MGIRDLITSLFDGERAERLEEESSDFRIVYNENGVTFETDDDRIRRIEAGGGSRRNVGTLVALRMLEDAGEAQRTRTGFWMPPDAMSRVDEEFREELGLPERFSGRFIAKISGTTTTTRFSISVRAESPHGPLPVRVRGGLLLIDSDTFLATEAQLRALRARDAHDALDVALRTEEANVQLVADLHDARDRGLRINLAHLGDFSTVVPRKVGLTATRTPDGGLDLHPSLEGVAHEDAVHRWRQVDGKDSGVLRVGKKLIKLGPAQMAAVNEVRRHRRIRPSDVPQFLRTPGAFIDSTLVDLENGFSVRVAGIGRVELIDFSGGITPDIDWFAREAVPVPVEHIVDRLRSMEDVHTLKQLAATAALTGADTVRFDGELIEVADSEAVRRVLEEATRRIEEGEVRPGVDVDQTPSKADSDAQVGFRFHDVDNHGALLRERIVSTGNPRVIDEDVLRRKPFPHQTSGIQWMLHLIDAASEEDSGELHRVQGALLADDMGLGKTFMTLVAISEQMRRQRDRHPDGPLKPVLVIAPLSLLENWESEVAQTFVDSPFDDIVVLQASRDLPRFRIKGLRKEAAQAAAALDASGAIDVSALRIALRVGPDHGEHRLDRPGRLVLTTYETLRDYQFSLSQIDWGFAVFDEAQAIKNPNTARTRAAKAVRSDFRLLVTGTPVENNLGEFWCLFDVAQPGLLGGWPEFRERYVVPAGADAAADRRLELGRQLRAAVGDFMLRREKEDHLEALPRKIVHSGFFDAASIGQSHDPGLARMMPAVQERAYREHLRSMRGGGAAALTALQNLRLVSIHPELGVGGARPAPPSDATAARMQIGESGKLAATMEVLHGVQRAGEKVIIFVQSKAVQMLLAAWIQLEFGVLPRIINGDTAATSSMAGDSRRQLITAFEAASGFNVIIMSPLAAGVGLTVTGANHVVHLERHWNPAKEAQATDRVYRIGQAKDVHVHLPASVLPDIQSFDVLLDQLLRSKTFAKDAVLAPAIATESDLVRAMNLAG